MVIEMARDISSHPYSRIHAKVDKSNAYKNPNVDVRSVADDDEDYDDIEAASPAAAKAEKCDDASVGRLLRLAAPEHKMMAVGMVFLVLSQLSMMALPWYFGRLIDCIADRSKSVEDARSEMQSIVVQLFVIMVTTSFCLFFRGFIFNGAGERVVARLRIKLFRAILRQEIAFFDTNKTGELLSRLSSDTSRLQNAATSDVSMFLRNCLAIVISFVMMVITSYKLTLVMLLCVPLLVAFAVTYGRFVRKISKTYSDNLASATNVASESISNIRTTRAFAAEDVELSRYTSHIGNPDEKDDACFCW